MHGREKSDLIIVAMKPANKAVSTAAEPVERRAEAKGNVNQQSTRRTQGRVSVSQVLDRIRQAVTKKTLCRHTPKVGRSYGAGRRRLWHLHRPYELMEAAPCCKSMISAEAWPRLIRSRPWWWSSR